jgi:hypothetical protein
MPCLNPDGTLTRFAHAVLSRLDAGPAGAAAIASASALPLYRIRATIRETAAAGLIEPGLGSASTLPIMEKEDDDSRPWALTPLGREALELGAPEGA